MMTSKQIMIGLSVVAVALFAGQAQAVVVSHSVSGQVFHSGGFENQPAANVSSQAGFETPGDFLPNNGAVAGDWVNNDSATNQDQSVQVTNNTTNPSGGALNGNNFLRINGWGPANSLTVASFAEQTNGTITAEWDAYIKSDPSNANHSFLGMMTDPSDYDSRFFRLVINSTAGNVVVKAGENGTADLGWPLPITMDQWQNYKLVTDLTNKTFSLSLDGGMASTGHWANGNTARGLYMMGNGGGDGSNGVLHIDGAPVPEPASVMLLAVGLVGLVGYGWRRRRSG